MSKAKIRAFVIGWPISNSLSPELHTYWLRSYGIDGEYEKIAVAPDDLDAFLANIEANGFVGGNVTIPHKENIVKNINQTGKTAKRLRAANTIWLENGILTAHNTDAYGFSANLDEFAPDWRKSETALVLGAGGASKAIVLALIDAGLKKIIIINRTRQRADDLAAMMANGCISGDFAELPKYLKQTDLMINTTSLGMKGQPRLDIDISMLPKTAIVTDIVYNPLKTRLLKDAEALGLTTVDGIGMLLHQAVPGFEKWFGIRPEVSSGLRQHMLDILTADSK